MRALSLSALLLLGFGCSTSHTDNDGGARDAGRRTDGAPLPVDSGPTLVDAGPARDSSLLRVDAGGGGECMHATDCVLIPRSCCGHCGAYTPEDVVAMARDKAADYRSEVCDGVACPACAAMPTPDLLADCVEGTCAAVDLYDPSMDHSNEFTRCESDDDCVLRSRQCCECGSTDEPIAVRRDQTSRLAFMFCDPAGGVCDDCERNYLPVNVHCAPREGSRQPVCQRLGAE